MSEISGDIPEKDSISKVIKNSRKMQVYLWLERGMRNEGKDMT